MIALILAAGVMSPQLVKLGNGLSMILDSDPREKMVTIVALVRAHDRPPRDLAALELVATAMALESKNFSKSEIDAITTYVGGSLRCQFVGDSIQVVLATAPTHFGAAATLLGDILQRATFTAESLTEARALLDAEHAKLSEDPAFVPLRALRDRLDAGPSALQPLSDDQAAGLYDFIVRPDRTAIAVVGNFDAAAVKSRLADSFEAWEKPLTAVRLPPPVAHSVPRSPAVAASSIVGPPPASPDFAAWMVACSALAMGKGSAMHTRLRDELGWTYEQSVSFTVRQRQTHALPFAVSHAASPGDLESELESIIASLPDRLTPAATARAKAYLSGWYRSGPAPPARRFAPFAQGHSDPASRAYWLAWWHLAGGSFTLDEAFLEATSKVTHDQVVAAARSFRSEFGAP
jgi:predicted Zn-dependent peptidase